MKNIDFIRRTSLSVPVVGNHSVSEETPSPPKVGTYIWVKQIFMFIETDDVNILPFDFNCKTIDLN